MLFVCHLLRTSAAYVDAMFVIAVCCRELVLNGSAVLPECRLPRSSVDLNIHI